MSSSGVVRCSTRVIATSFSPPGCWRTRCHVATMTRAWKFWYGEPLEVKRVWMVSPGSPQSLPAPAHPGASCVLKDSILPSALGLNWMMPAALPPFLAPAALVLVLLFLAVLVVLVVVAAASSAAATPAFSSTALAALSWSLAFLSAAVVEATEECTPAASPPVALPLPPFALLPVLASMTADVSADAAWPVPVVLLALLALLPLPDTMLELPFFREPLPVSVVAAADAFLAAAASLVSDCCASSWLTWSALISSWPD
mmetsp:Transcript_4320/g.10744  ORF Transcript_4320/g.10744 Transcript_4320/m.10744 type:complete len:258 (-) Transcript_4320:500-1273(-)